MRDENGNFFWFPKVGGEKCSGTVFTRNLWTAETWQKNYSAKLAGIHKAAKKMICLSPEYGTLLGKIEVLWYLWYFFPIKLRFLFLLDWSYLALNCI
jgi:hypothetical protein